MTERQFFAQIDENGVAIRVSVVNRDFLEANPERYPGKWVETFYDTPGKTYASTGLVYNEETEDFVYPVIEVTE